MIEWPRAYSTETRAPAARSSHPPPRLSCSLLPPPSPVMAVSASSTALAKLEPFLLLAKSARGAAAAKLISEATAAPGCYVFSELLECDTIREVSRKARPWRSYMLAHRVPATAGRF